MLIAQGKERRALEERRKSLQEYRFELVRAWAEREREDERQKLLHRNMGRSLDLDEKRLRWAERNGSRPWWIVNRRFKNTRRRHIMKLLAKKLQ